MNRQYTLGLDVAKRTISVCLLDLDGKPQRREILNSTSGFVQLIAWLGKTPPETVHVCLEPTGKYSRAIAAFLLERGFVISQVNSHVVSNYAKVKRVRGKTDRVDAFLLADFCLKENPPAWVPAEKARVELREIEARIFNLDEAIQQELNRLEAGMQNDFARADIEAHIAYLRSSKERLEKEAKRIALGDVVLQPGFEIVSSIIGIGERSALRLLAYVPFRELPEPRSAGCYSGLTSKKHESGTSISRRPSISRVGPTEVRKMLYHPAMTAIQHNPQMRAFAERLAQKGKPPKVIICAVMRKLVVLAATLIRKGELYDCTRDLEVA